MTTPKLRLSGQNSMIRGGNLFTAAARSELSQGSSQRKTFSNFLLVQATFSPSSINNMVGNERFAFFRGNTGGADDTQNSVVN